MIVLATTTWFQVLVCEKIFEYRVNEDGSIELRNTYTRDEPKGKRRRSIS